jgi:hypothetical protein
MKYRRHPYGKITSSYEKFKTRAQVNTLSSGKAVDALNQCFEFFI